MTGFKDHFSTTAASYAAFRPSYPPELAAWLAGPTQGGVVWDCGCGTGQLSSLLADHFETVIATDASAQQIAAAPPHPKISYRVATAEASGLANHAVDLVTVAQAAHWFDQDAFHAEVRRVTRPGGVLALISYGVIKADGEPGAVIAHFYHQTLRGLWPPERAHVEAGYKTLPFPFDEIAPPVMAMRAAWTLARTLGYATTWSAVRQLEKAAGPGAFAAFQSDLTAAWGAPETAREIRWPLSFRIGRV